MGMKANPNASMHFRKAAIMNAAMATALSPTRLHVLRFKNGAENARSRRDPGPVEGVLQIRSCRSARKVSEATRHLQRARLIFNVRNGITADEADNKLNLKPPGRIEYFPMVFEEGPWTLYMAPGNGYIYHARKPGRIVKPSQPSPLRECVTLVDDQAGIEVTPPADTRTSKLHKTRPDHHKQIAKHPKSALERLRKQAPLDDSFVRVASTESREPGNCQASAQRNNATKR
nr:hypothetical protein B0A51_03178 [Rachicladosporium sp. CCFEE 5018]